MWGGRTPFLACLSSADSSGSLGLTASFSTFFSSASFFLDLDFVLLASAVLAALGAVVAPLAVLGVELVVSLILGFLTESDRWGV